MARATVRNCFSVQRCLHFVFLTISCFAGCPPHALLCGSSYPGWDPHACEPGYTLLNDVCVPLYVVASLSIFCPSQPVVCVFDSSANANILVGCLAPSLSGAYCEVCKPGWFRSGAACQGAVCFAHGLFGGPCSGRSLFMRCVVQPVLRTAWPARTRGLAKAAQKATNLTSTRLTCALVRVIGARHLSSFTHALCCCVCHSLSLQPSATPPTVPNA